MRFFILILLSVSLTACNSVYIKPHTLNKNDAIYATRGGYSMKRSIKQAMEEREYNIHVGTLQQIKDSDPDDTEVFTIPEKVRYAVRVTERKETLRPIWCMFNGFWWWDFNISIVERESNEELLSWRGRGCANSSLRRLNKYLDELEMETKDKQ